MSSLFFSCFYRFGALYKETENAIPIMSISVQEAKESDVRKFTSNE